MGMSPADIKFINEMKVGHLCDAFTQLQRWP